MFTVNICISERFLSCFCSQLSVILKVINFYDCKIVCCISVLYYILVFCIIYFIMLTVFRFSVLELTQYDSVSLLLYIFLPHNTGLRYSGVTC
jgi:hypothetical protein